MTANDGYWAVSMDEGKDGARKAFVRRYGREPLETLDAGTAWLAGPAPGAAPMFAGSESESPESPASRGPEEGNRNQGRLF